MFYYLKGNPVLKQDSFLVLDIGGVGFKVYSSHTTLSSISLNHETTLYTYTYVREDALDIFGFSSTEELAFFEKLLTISGVGPRLALAILSTFSPQEIMIAILSNDAKKLSKAPGVGQKLAQRMILELKDKISDEEVLSGVSPVATMKAENTEAVNALMVLGYGEAEAHRAVSAVGAGNTLEDTIKKALLLLAR